MHAPIGQHRPTAPTLPTLHSRRYLEILLMAAAVGVPVSAVAWGYMQLVHQLQHWVYVDLPAAVGFEHAPIWWPVAPMLLSGLLVGLSVRYLPGHGGDSPADGFHAGPAPPLRELPGILLATMAGLGLGAVIGPEAPLIALGAGLAAHVPEVFRRGHDVQAVALVGAAGSFAAISLLLAAGIGALVIVGLGNLTGLGTAAIAIPGLPTYVRPDVAQFGWAIAIGLMAPFVGLAIQRLSRAVRDRVRPRPVLGTPVVGLGVAGLAIAYAALTGQAPTAVLFSGQLALGPLLLRAADYSVLTLVLLIVFKGLAYALSLGAFRGGPVFPGMFLGAAGGVALSHLPGLPVVAGAAMGIGAMCVVMLRLPLISVLLATLLLAQGLAVMPLVIVAVVVAHVLTAYLSRSRTASEPPVFDVAKGASP